jgi:hypothetical protein
VVFSVTVTTSTPVPGTLATGASHKSVNFYTYTTEPSTGFPFLFQDKQFCQSTWYSLASSTRSTSYHYPLALPVYCTSSRTLPWTVGGLQMLASQKSRPFYTIITRLSTPLIVLLFDEAPVPLVRVAELQYHLCRQNVSPPCAGFGVGRVLVQLIEDVVTHRDLRQPRASN